ncbi:MAG: sulfite exporter TauE/SafE family protein [Verrucomicrobiota bacterium]
MPLLFFLIALLYTMAGFGGGSSYLAVLSLTGRPLDEIATLALLCNLAATSVAVYHFGKNRLIHWPHASPLLISSVPAAFIGGSIRIDAAWHLLLLATALTVAGIHLFAGAGQETHRPSQHLSARTRWAGGFIIGAGLGLLSGVVGIGGGIFLAPLLYILRWTDARHIAGLACFFICCNSIAGIGGRWLRLGDVMWTPDAVWLLIAVLGGAFIGSRLSTQKLLPPALRLVTALLVTAVAIRLWLRWFTY